MMNKNVVEKTKYIVHITEILGRDVLIEAESPADAEEIVEELCNNETLNLDMTDWVERNVECLRVATFTDQQHLAPIRKE